MTITRAGLVNSVAGGIYASLPNPVVDKLGRMHALHAMVQSLRVPLSILRGPALRGCGDAAVLVAGEGPDLEYLITRFFSAAPRCEPLGEVSLPILPRELSRRMADVDLVLARVDSQSSRLLFRNGYLRLPLWIESELAIPSDPEKHMCRTRRLKSDLIRIHAGRLGWHLRYDQRSFDDFYDNMYCAYARHRHGPLRIDWNKHKLRRCFRQGALLYVTRQDAVISAILLSEGKEFRFVVLGTAKGEDWPRQIGGLAALYLFSLKYGQQRGYQRIFLGGVRPCLSDNVIRYKEKWGVSLSCKEGVFHDFLVSWAQLTKPVAAFLHDNPLIFRDGAGLSAVTSDLHQNAGPGAAGRCVWLPGLSRLLVVGEDSGGSCASCKSLRREAKHCTTSLSQDPESGAFWHPVRER